MGPARRRGVAVDEPEHAGFWDGSASRVALLGSAVLCFARTGFHATTTRDITAAVGLSPGALYVHFPSKEAVLFEIARTGHQRSLDALRAEPDTGDSRAHLHRLVVALVTWHARHHTVARVCQYELAALEPEHLAVVRELRQEFTGVLRAAVQRGVADGLFDVPDVNRAVRAVLSLGIDLVRWYRLDGADPPETIGEAYADLALRMLGSPPDAVSPRCSPPTG